MKGRMYYAMGCDRCRTAVKYHPLTIGDVMVEVNHQCSRCASILERVAYDSEERRDEFIAGMKRVTL